MLGIGDASISDENIVLSSIDDESFIDVESIRLGRTKLWSPSQSDQTPFLIVKLECKWI